MTAEPRAAGSGHRVRVVIGASAGGVEALQGLVSGLPEGLAASLFAVLHMPEGGTSTLPAILNRVGAYTGHTLASEQSEAVEAALWTATRTLEERAALLDTLAGRMQTRNHSRSAQRFSSRADDALRQADAIRGLLTQEPPADVPILPPFLPRNDDVEEFVDDNRNR